MLYDYFVNRWNGTLERILDLVDLVSKWLKCLEDSLHVSLHVIFAEALWELKHHKVTYNLCVLLNLCKEADRLYLIVRLSVLGKLLTNS